MQTRDLVPDLIALNGRIFTMDAENAVAQAVAIKDGRFLALGSTAEIEKLAGPCTHRIDLGGRTVLPGLFDGHNHLMEVGIKLAMIRLDECKSPEEMMELVRERARLTPPGVWIIGQGWNENNFTHERLPTRHDIDAATSEHPVILMRFFNMDLVNSYALRLAGIDCHTPDPANGKIERDADGEPNGLLRARAKLLARQLVPQPTHEQMQQAIKSGCEEMNHFGITSVIDPGLYPWEIRAYQAAHQAGMLSVRTGLMPSWHGFREEETEEQLDSRARELGLASGWGDEWLRLVGLKMGIDGGTSSHTAYMYEPFEGETIVKNYNRLDTDKLLRHFRAAQELNWDVGIHCCGDRSQDMTVDALAQVAREVPWPDARHSIIHAYFPTPRALDQMARFKIAAVIQPTFIYWEGDMIFRDVGERRAQNYKPARKYLNHGVVLTASSDIPSTVSANPFIALYTLVTRRNNLGHLVAPDQAISREEALRAYTIASTWLTREEKLKGTIAVNKLADMVVLDRDYFGVREEEIKDIQADMTLVGGQVVWKRDPTWCGYSRS